MPVGADLYPYNHHTLARHRDTWHRVQTDASVTIRTLMSILAQRVSHIRAETDDPAKLGEEMEDTPAGALAPRCVKDVTAHAG